jgi:lipopolysaccharide/colanic/teichoic acid biosynthesis glycosyltransferase
MSSTSLARAAAALSPGIALLVVGDGPAAERLYRELRLLGDRAPHMVGILASRRPSSIAEWPYLGELGQLPALLASRAVTDVALCLGATDQAQLEGIVRRCDEVGVRVSIPLPEPLPASARERAAYRVAKRAVDVVGGLAGMLLAAPILGLAAIAVLLTDGRPVLFAQLRAGEGGRPFTIYKFRTMAKDADSQRAALRDQSTVSGGAAFKLDEDPRVTRVGRWLRRLSIDELPQLWNVVRGEMSLVGPRPHPYDDLAGYQAWHFQRLAVKPGLTGLWQVELRGDSDFDRWVQRDVDYIARRSMLLDLSIILRTIPALLRGTGR